MLAAILGLIDLLAAISLIAYAFGYPLPYLQAGAALGLTGKGAMFITDALSVIDVLIGIAMFGLLWMELPMLALGLAIYLACKGLYSFA